jgi:hypothetical protein
VSGPGPAWPAREGLGLSLGHPDSGERFPKPLHHHLVPRMVRVKDLLAVNMPFCEMNFDAVRPLVLTADEKAILQEYLKRGGFILFFIDAYPYTQDEFWKITNGR